MILNRGDRESFSEGDDSFGLGYRGQTRLNGSTSQADYIEEARAPQGGAGERKTTMEGTWRACKSELPSRSTESQPSGNNNKCFFFFTSK